jgi:hypothetical protein
LLLEKTNCKLFVTYTDEVVHHEHIGRFDVLVDDRRFLVVTKTQSHDQLGGDDSRFVGSCSSSIFFHFLDPFHQRPAAAELGDEEADAPENPFRLLVFQKIDKFDHISMISIFS